MKIRTTNAGTDLGPTPFRRDGTEATGGNHMKTVLWCICLVISLAGDVLAREATPVSVEVVAKTSESWDGSALPEYPGGRPEITILRIIIPPMVELPMHEHPVINAGVLLRGKLTVIKEDGQTLHLSAGEPIVELVNQWHYGKNEGTEPAEIIVFYAGISGSPITISK